MLFSRTGVFAFINMVFLLASCASNNDDDTGSSCTPISVAGEPDMTGIPSFNLSSVNAGDLITITVPVDDDVSHVKLSMMSSLIETNIYVKDVIAEAITPGAGVWQHEFASTAYEPGLYFPVLDLCTDGNSCTGASTGIGTSYSNTNFTSLDANYTRNVFWNSGQTSFSGENACISVPYVTVN